MALHAHCSVIYSHQDMEAPQWASRVEFNKEDAIYIHSGMMIYIYTVEY